MLYPCFHCLLALVRGYKGNIHASLRASRIEINDVSVHGVRMVVIMYQHGAYIS